jgi:hypothetical protein
MHGFYELIAGFAKVYPDDWWIKRYQETEKIMPGNLSQCAFYDKALQILDDESWAILYKRIFEEFPRPLNDRGKNQFFNLLNEALAYEYLVSQGYINVRMIRPEKKGKKKTKETPDMSYQTAFGKKFCEVKTIGRSDDHVEMYKSHEVFDGNVYRELSIGFMSKLDSVIKKARDQIQSVGGNGLIYIVVEFDDYTLMYYDKYKKQLDELIYKQYNDLEIYIRVGVEAYRFIHYKSL